MVTSAIRRPFESRWSDLYPQHRKVGQAQTQWSRRRWTAAHRRPQWRRGADGPPKPAEPQHESRDENRHADVEWVEYAATHVVDRRTLADVRFVTTMASANGAVTSDAVSGDVTSDAVSGSAVSGDVIAGAVSGDEDAGCDVASTVAVGAMRQVTDGVHACDSEDDEPNKQQPNPMRIRIDTSTSSQSRAHIPLPAELILMPVAIGSTGTGSHVITAPPPPQIVGVETGWGRCNRP